MARFAVLFVVLGLTIPTFANSPGVPAVGWVSFAGNEQCATAGGGIVCDPGYAIVSVYGYQVTHNYVQGDTPQSVSEAFAAAFNISSSPVTAIATDGYLTLTSKARGSSANSQLTATSSGDISTETSGMIGGRDGARNFRMAMWFDPDTTYSDVTFNGLPISQPTPTTSPFDPAVALPTPQPIGHSILIVGPWASSNFSEAWQSFIQQDHYDFSRIDAVIVDEPYWSLLGEVQPPLPRDSSPCNPSDQSRFPLIQQAFGDLQTLAQLIHASPTTRFWVNFSRPELDWMMQPETPEIPYSCSWLNASYIDVVSLDYYGVHFNGTDKSSAVQPYYDWLSAHPSYPGQQLALLPSTSFGNESAVSQGEFMKEFFDYAAVRNQSCNLPASSVGTTGIFDNCPIWLVSGWEFKCSVCTGYVGLADPSRAPVRAEWLAELSNPANISSPLATVSLGTTPFTYFLTAGPEAWAIWCSGSPCTWDDPTGDAHAPLAAPASPLTAVSTPSGPLLHYLSSNNHLIHVWAGNGFSDTWQDETSASGALAPGTGSPLATVVGPDGTPFTYFLTSGNEAWVIWCSSSSCAWDDPTGDAKAPLALAGSPLSAVWTPNGPLVHYLTSNNHLIHVWAGNGFSDTWQDETSASGALAPGTGSPLATVVSPDGTPFTYYLTPGNEVWVIWCFSSSCIWDDPTGNAKAPLAVSGSALTAIWTSNGPLLHYLTPDGHLIALWAGNGFSDTWQDETAASGAIPAAQGTSLTTVLTSSGWVTHFTVPGGPVYSITCTASLCTNLDETASANALPSGSF